MLEPPTSDSREDHATRLSDAACWRPFAEAPLAGAGPSESSSSTSGFVVAARRDSLSKLTGRLWTPLA